MKEYVVRKLSEDETLEMAERIDAMHGSGLTQDEATERCLLDFAAMPADRIIAIVEAAYAYLGRLG